jgi:HTH-type transcriptional regulator / antitoxin MqsA
MPDNMKNGRHRRCPVCGRGILKRRFISENFDYDEHDDVVVVKTYDVPVDDCDSCGECFSGPEAARIRHEAIGRALGLLQPQEIRTLRERMGQSLVQFGKLLGVSSERLSQWENGTAWQDRTADRLIRLLALKPDNLQFVQSLVPVLPEQGASPSPELDSTVRKEPVRRVIRKEDRARFGL